MLITNFAKTFNYNNMEYSPSFNGLSPHKPVLRTKPIEVEERVTTQRPAPSTPAPRGHA